MKRRMSWLFLVLVLTGCTSATVKRDLAIEYYNLGNAYLELKDYEKASVFLR